MEVIASDAAAFSGDSAQTRIDAGGDAPFAQHIDHGFGRNVADQLIASERTASQSRQSAVKAPASRFISGQYLFRRTFPLAM